MYYGIEGEEDVEEGDEAIEGDEEITEGDADIAADEQEEQP